MELYLCLFHALFSFSYCLFQEAKKPFTGNKMECEKVKEEIAWGRREERPLGTFFEMEGMRNEFQNKSKGKIGLQTTAESVNRWSNWIDNYFWNRGKRGGRSWKHERACLHRLAIPGSADAENRRSLELKLVLWYSGLNSHSEIKIKKTEMCVFLNKIYICEEESRKKKKRNEE